MDADLKKELHKIATTIRGLSIEGVEKANSGHPGMPLGCAELGAYLYGHLMRHNPKNPDWVGRDRFVLSAGHGSMWLYSCLHLAGFDLPMEELKNFRQLHSKTPGHPEFHMTPGVEATTGPLGQGIGNAVGQALGMKILAEKFNTEKHKLFSNKIYCICGDGCLMEGISHEACSLAGHLGLDNLVLIFDSNKITLDGPLGQSGSENTAERFKAYGFDVFDIEGNDLDQIDRALSQLQDSQKRPTIVIAHTTIGFGSPNKAGTHKVHGSPLGAEEIKLTKESLGIPEEDFYVPGSVLSFFEQKQKRDLQAEGEWNQMFAEWKEQNPQAAKDFDAMVGRTIPGTLEKELIDLEMGKDSIAGRSASNIVLQKLGEHLPFLYGGSADLSGSDKTMMEAYPLIAPHDFKGRNIKYGVREFGMAAIAAGLFQTHMILPYVGTFLTFSDYMRNAVRLAALSGYHTFYQFTHDSIFLGEDGPTHQSVEHFAALRAIPKLHVFRPADSWEIKASWWSMLKYEGPSAIILSRQNLPELSEARAVSFESGVGRGGYILRKERDRADFCLMATGSEVSLALDVAVELEKRGKQVRVVSMPCMDIFAEQSKEYIESVVGGDVGKRVSIEAGIAQGWYRWIGTEGIAICMEGFGESAPAADLAQEFGFNVDAILNRLRI